MAKKADSLTISDLLGLSPSDFERMVGRLFESMGYDVTATKQTGDQGVDLRLTREGEVAIAQCKRYSGTVGQPAIRDFYGTMQHEKVVRGYFVTTGVFSLAASTWAQGKAIVLVDGPDLVAAVANAAIEIGARKPLSAPQKSLLEIVRAAHANPTRLGRILVDGPAPTDTDYRELAQYVGGNLGLGLSYLEGSGLRNFDAWRAREEMEPGLLFVNELDAAPRKSMEDVMALGSLGGRVLVATRWDMRLPRRILAEFSTVISASDVEWELVADRKSWKKRWKAAAEDAESRRKKRDAEAKRRLKEAHAEVERVLTERHVARRKRKQQSTGSVRAKGQRKILRPPRRTQDDN